MGFKWCVLATVLVLHAITAAHIPCPIDSNCDCRHNPGLELDCNIDGNKVQISLLPDTYLVIKCINTSTLNFDKLPKCANPNNTFQSVTFKNCPLPPRAFKEVLENIGVSKTFSLIFQNAKKISGYFDRKHFTGLQNLTKLLISVRGLAQLPDDLFEDIDKLQWLTIRSNHLNITQKLFRPLGRLETLEISHNYMSNISLNFFSHLSVLKRLSLWQNNVTWFSEDMFIGADILEELVLSSLGLDELPETIFKPLKNLKKLTLFSNNFSSLPQFLFQSNKQLDTVIMLNNDVALRKLPERLFGDSRSLTQVFLNRCGLEEVPHNLFESSWSILAISLAHNNIRTLPDKLFKDQYMLCKLDLSHNKLENLSPHIFSSLKVLRVLHLSYNYLTTISGITFAPLMHLQVFTVDYNRLQSITSQMFVNNQERMYISMAYNKLDLENFAIENVKFRVPKKSPFGMLYKLQLLNLSHNSFRHTFKDWWENGHDVLDISHNNLEYLRDDIVPSETYIVKPIRELYISHNPLKCSCSNTDVIDFLLKELKTKIPDHREYNCSFWRQGTCDTRKNISLAMIVFILIGTLCITGSYSMIIRSISKAVKRVLRLFVAPMFNTNDNQNQNACLVVEYANSDNEFVQKEFLPAIKSNLNLKLYPKLMNSAGAQALITTNFFMETTTNFVIFTPNYLALRYCNVGIKKIRGEIMKERDKIFIFVNNGPDNAVYTFLKEKRNKKTMLLWEDVDIWKKLKVIMKLDDRKEEKIWVKSHDYENI